MLRSFSDLQLILLTKQEHGSVEKFVWLTGEVPQGKEKKKKIHVMVMSHFYTVDHPKRKCYWTMLEWWTLSQSSEILRISFSLSMSNRKRALQKTSATKKENVFEWELYLRLLLEWHNSPEKQMTIWNSAEQLCTVFFFPRGCFDFLFFSLFRMSSFKQRNTLDRIQKGKKKQKNQACSLCRHLCTWEGNYGKVQRGDSHL